MHKVYKHIGATFAHVNLTGHHISRNIKVEGKIDT